MKNINKVLTLVKLISKVSPGYILLNVINSLIRTSILLLNIVLPKFLIDELILNENIDKIILFGSLIVIVNLLFAFVNKTFARLLDVRNEYVNRKITEEMARKITEIEYSYLEDPYYLDLKERAVFASVNQSAISQIIYEITSITSGIISLFGLITIILSLSWVLVVVLLIGSFIVIIISWLFKNYQSGFFKNIIPLNRKYGYYLGLSVQPQIQKDLRLYNMEPLFTNSVLKMNRSINNRFKKFYFVNGLVSGFQFIVNSIQSGIIYIYITLRTLSTNYGTRIGIGDFTMYVNTAITFTRTFNKLYNDFFNFGVVLDYLDPFLEFMQLKESKKSFGGKKLKNIETIEFKNVSFKYPKTEKYILDNISFKIEKGEKISIVGLNGAGKTTLIKLLCRLYRIEEGEILINGINIFDYDYKNYIDNISAVFQDYRLFAFTILENLIGDELIDNDKIDEIINEVGLKEKIEELPNGINTPLNKAYDEDGIELSGGQNQKLAIARALYKNSNLVILDEPTSALDPIAEAEIYKHFNDMVLDKTAIYISHRMSSSVFCDKIVVIDNGKVIDFDSHKALMRKKNSLYYKLFSSQAVNYKVEH
ncbi:MAG: ABC transporter ATP-binding protein [Bacilli bacterium]